MHQFGRPRPVLARPGEGADRTFVGALDRGTDGDRIILQRDTVHEVGVCAICGNQLLIADRLAVIPTAARSREDVGAAVARL